MKQKTKEETFRAVYHEYRHKIYRICYAYIYSREAVDDLFQEIMLNIWNSLDSFRGESHMGTWIYRVALNTALSHNRSFKKQSLRIAEFSQEALHMPLSDPPDDIQTKLDHLAKAISQLDKQDRLIISLVLEELTYEAIAEIVGITPNYVGVKVNRIKKQLKKLMSDE